MTGLRRRQLAAAAAVLVGVCLGAGLGAGLGWGGLARPGGSGARPDEAGGLVAAPGRQLGDSPARPARPLTYAEGRVLHLGDQRVATGKDVLSLDVVDGGAAFTTLDGGIWFTDGSKPVLVGITTPGVVQEGTVAWGPGGRPDEWVVSDNSGSHFAWFEFPTGDRPELVVFDARTRQRVARVPVDVKPSCALCLQLVSVGDRAVYWTNSLWRGLGSLGEGRDSPRPFRHEYAGPPDPAGPSATSQVPLGTLRADLLGRARMLVVGDSLERGRLTDGIGQEFAVDGGHLTRVPDTQQVFDPRTGQRLQFRAPARYGYGIVERLRLYQWLDDDRFALLDATGWNAGDFTGEELLVCRISSMRCTIAVHRPAASGSPVIPELATPGAAQALARATGD